jgi:hypothetical protein
METDGRKSRRGGPAGAGVQSPVGAGTVDEKPTLGSREAAEYVASLLEGLWLTAHRAQLPFLAYLISVALEEANNEKQKAESSP